MRIGNREIGTGRCFIIGEVGCAHDGSLALAHAFIDAIADAGADCAKFQCHLAYAESTRDEPWRVEPAYPQDSCRFDYWKRMEFTEGQWAGLREHTERRGLEFLCSVFSVEAVELLQRIGVKAWKIPSGEITNDRLLKTVMRTAKPVILSTGMSTLEEAREAARIFYAAAVLQCTSRYPTPPQEVGLNVLDALREIENGPVGLSDHSGVIWPSISAVAHYGADIVEVHVRTDPPFGFDASSSLTLERFRQLVDGIRAIEMIREPVDKDEMAKKLEPMRELFMERHKRRAAIA